MNEAGKMSDDPNDVSGWHRSIIEQLHDSEKVVEAVPTGPADKLDNPDSISVKLTHGTNSKVLNDILEDENYVILLAEVGDSGELMIDITVPRKVAELFIDVH
jgi:hypothetical protein